MERAERILADRGIRPTWRRRALLDVFSATDAHLSADDVLMELRRRKLKINATTVYRNLEMLAQEDVLRRVDFHDGRCRFELNRSTCHHHLHCTKCGRVVEFGGCALTELEKDLATRTDFAIARHHLEIFGLCPTCR